MLLYDWGFRRIHAVAHAQFVGASFVRVAPCDFGDSGIGHHFFTVFRWREADPPEFLFSYMQHLFRFHYIINLVKTR